MIINYALQTHDAGDREDIGPRYCSNSRSEVTEKCTTSFMLAVEDVAKQSPTITQTVNIFDDHSSDKTVTFLKYLTNYFNKGNIQVNFNQLPTSGIASSIRACYEWLENTPGDLIYQVQDDYLFSVDAITEMIDLFFQILGETNEEAMIFPYNDPYFWSACYKYRPTPRTLIPGKKRYWINFYDLPCTFLTSKNQFGKHWELYDIFFKILEAPPYTELESKSLSLILRDKNVLGVHPVNSSALHMQSELFKDPYIDWKILWDSVKKI